MMDLFLQVGLFTEIGPLSCFVSRHVSITWSLSVKTASIVTSLDAYEQSWVEFTSFVCF